MSMKHYLFLLFTLVTLSSTFGQQGISIEIGPTFDRLSGLYSGSGKNHRNIGIGHSISLTADFFRKNRFSLSTGIGWVEKNIKYKNAISPSSIFQQETYRFIQVPVSMGVKIYDHKLSVDLHGGIVTNYWLNTLIEGFHPNIFDIETGNGPATFMNTNFKTKQYPGESNNRLQFGSFLGISAYHPLSTSLNLLVNNRYYSFFTPIEKKNSISGHHRFNDFSCTIGFSKTF